MTHSLIWGLESLSKTHIGICVICVMRHTKTEERFPRRFLSLKFSQAPFSAAHTTIDHRVRARNPAQSAEFSFARRIVSA